MKDLCKAMGIEWHDLVINIPRITCSCGVAWQGEFPMGDFMRHRNPSPTDEAFCWKVLTYMMGREDWRGFHNQTWDEYVADDRTWSVGGFFPWLLTAPPDGKVRLVPLAAGWVREHGGGE